jgi:hypothetical protein
MKTIVAILAWSATLLAGNAQQSLEEIAQNF